MKFPEFNLDLSASYTRIISMYVILDQVTGEKYIGSTNNTSNRMFLHRHSLRRGKHYSSKLQAAFDADHSFEVKIYITETREEAYDLEQKELDKYPDFVGLFNQSKDARAPKKGVVVSEETKNKLSAIGFERKNKGKDVTSKKISSNRPLEINFIRYDNVRDAGDKLGLTPNVVMSRAYSQRLAYRLWFFLDE